MKLSRQTSFRRILLLRIILVSLPVLLIGVAVAFRQARDTFQESAEKNLRASADSKAHEVETAIRSLQTSLVAAGETLTLRTGTLEESHEFLSHLSHKIPLNDSCLQLVNWQTGAPLTGTCDVPLWDTEANPQTELNILDWPQYSTGISDPFYTHYLEVQTQLPPEEIQTRSNQLSLFLSTPIYGQDGQLRYVLLVKGCLRLRGSVARRSLLGSTVVIDQRGTILAHPLREQVGKNVDSSMEVSHFQDIVTQALEGEQDVGYLHNFSDSTERWVAGYSSADIVVSPTENETWVVLAVTQLDSALYGLNNIKRIVLMLTGGLIVAHLLVMLYMARDLARPIEQLGEYARRIHDPRSTQEVPKDFRIREINQLSHVLDNMVKRLEDRAKELETAWQEAQAANKLKDEILANTSHELRTPLNGIIGCVRLIKDGLCDDPEEEYELLERTDEAAIHLLKIINDILDIAKIESGTSTLALEAVTLDRTMREVIDLQLVEASQKGLWLVAKSGPSVLVQVDPAKFKQVLLNVVSNAIKFTEEGGITIETQIQIDLEQGSETSGWVSGLLQREGPVDRWVVVSIRDTGIGINANKLDKLCNPFYMADGSKTRRYGGTGLGLAISRNLIELMGGRIGIYSEGLGTGTTVKIALPIVEVLDVSAEADCVDSTLETASPPDQGDDDRATEVLDQAHTVAIAPPL
ncbi:MAG: sensor histidine kinase [Cyanothece sp. SIO2G6]|nr:sensor histidine kinase [Cyanothece sp. SIO2G6]